MGVTVPIKELIGDSVTTTCSYVTCASGAENIGKGCVFLECFLKLLGISSPLFPAQAPQDGTPTVIRRTAVRETCISRHHVGQTEGP